MEGNGCIDCNLPVDSEESCDICGHGLCVDCINYAYDFQYCGNCYGDICDEEEKMKTVTERLGNISKIMSSGTEFVKIRFMLEDCEEDAEKGIVGAKSVTKVVEDFEKLIEMCVEEE